MNFKLIIIRIVFLLPIAFTFCNTESLKAKKEIASNINDNINATVKGYKINSFLFFNKGMDADQVVDSLKKYKVSFTSKKLDEYKDLSGNLTWSIPDLNDLSNLDINSKNYLKKLKIISGKNLPILDYKLDEFDLLFFEDKLVNIFCHKKVEAKGIVEYLFSGKTIEDFRSFLGYHIINEEISNKYYEQLRLIDDFTEGLQYKYGPPSETYGSAKNEYDKIEIYGDGHKISCSDYKGLKWNGLYNSDCIEYIRFDFGDELEEFYMTKYDFLDENEKKKINTLQNKDKTLYDQVVGKYKYNLSSTLLIHVEFERKIPNEIREKLDIIKENVNNINKHKIDSIKNEVLNKKLREYKKL